MTSGFALLRAHPAFARLWLARLLSTLGDGMTLVALMVLVTAKGGGGGTMSLVLVAEILPSFLSPLAGALADRWNRRRLLVGCELAEGAIMAALALWLPPLPILLVAVATRSTLATAVRAAQQSAVPLLVGEETFDSANALLRAGDEGAAIVGPALAGVLAFVGPAGLFAIDAGSFFVAGAVLLGFTVRSVASEGEDILSASLAGLREVARQPTARAVALALATFVLFAAMENVGRPFLATAVLGGGQRAIGLLQAAPQVGLVLGLAVIARFGLGRHATAVLIGGMALCSVGILATGAAPTLVVAMATQLVAGVGNGATLAAVDAVLQRAGQGPMLGRIFANVYGAAQIAAGLAYVAGGPLLDATSPRTLFIVVGLGGLSAAGLAALLLPRKP